VQTPQSTKQGYNAAGTPDYRIQPLPFAPQDGYHEYRFDWTPEHLTFWIDGQFVWSMTEQIPTSPGHLVVNHWSNGDPNWSGGPPAEDAVLTVAYVKAYFNSSDPKRRDTHARTCPVFNPDKVCEIPATNATLDPNDMKTSFFSEHPRDAPGQVLYNATDFPDVGNSIKASSVGVMQLALFLAAVWVAWGTVDITV
jgi:beta-glucanase (GH16 family)